MKSLTLKHLRYFEALAAHGHFSRAAEACLISQPALSLQIKDLENIMGGPLVERAAREVRLTALGQDLIQHSREILRRVEDLDALARKSSGPFAGRLRIGVIPTVAPLSGDAYRLSTVPSASYWLLDQEDPNDGSNST